MITLEEKKKQGIEKGTYALVKGEFSPSEGSEIINDLFTKKINFHEVKSFSQLIRFGTKNPSTLNRINELKLDQKYATELIAKAEETGKSVRLNSTISIELI